MAIELKWACSQHWRAVAMLEPLDRCRKESTLFQFTSKRLREFINPNHLLIQIDDQLDFARLSGSRWRRGTVPTSADPPSIPR